jgi:hypothetical protein
MYNQCRLHEWAPYIIPGIVYYLSTKLPKGVTHDCLGQDTEVKLLEFLT